MIKFLTDSNNNYSMARLIAAIGVVLSFILSISGIFLIAIGANEGERVVFHGVTLFGISSALKYGQKRIE